MYTLHYSMANTEISEKYEIRFYHIFKEDFAIYLRLLITFSGNFQKMFGALVIFGETMANYIHGKIMKC